MAGGVVAMTLDAFDFGLESFDSSGKLIERQRPEVLLDEQDERIVRFRGKEIVEIHGAER